MWSGAEFGVKKEDLQWLEQEKVREGRRVFAEPKPNEPTKPTKPSPTHQANQTARPSPSPAGQKCCQSASLHMRIDCA